MRFKTKNTRLILIFTIILSFIAQPALAISLSTAMQLDSSTGHMDHPLSTMAPSDMVTKAATAEPECDHMMPDKALPSLTTNATSNMDMSTNTSKNCLFTCQFCMSIVFILPHSLEIFSDKEAHIVSADSVQEPLSIFHIPAYEPPRLAS